MKMKLPGYVSKGMKLLEENGYECYVVGGAVRSFLCICRFMTTI